MFTLQRFHYIFEKICNNHLEMFDDMEKIYETYMGENRIRNDIEIYRIDGLTYHYYKKQNQLGRDFPMITRQFNFMQFPALFIYKPHEKTYSSQFPEYGIQKIFDELKKWIESISGSLNNQSQNNIVTQQKDYQESNKDQEADLQSKFNTENLKELSQEIEIVKEYIDQEENQLKEKIQQIYAKINQKNDQLNQNNIKYLQDFQVIKDIIVKQSANIDRLENSLYVQGIVLVIIFAIFIYQKFKVIERKRNQFRYQQMQHHIQNQSTNENSNVSFNI